MRRPAPRRLLGLEWATVVGHHVPVADSIAARVLGLALLDRDDAGPGLLLPRCRSVHTFGMRFAIDVVFLDRDGRVVSCRRSVPGRRVAVELAAYAVLELPAERR